MSVWHIKSLLRFLKPKRPEILRRPPIYQPCYTRSLHLNAFSILVAAIEEAREKIKFIKRNKKWGRKDINSISSPWAYWVRHLTDYAALLSALSETNAAWIIRPITSSAHSHQIQFFFFFYLKKICISLHLH